MQAMNGSAVSSRSRGRLIGCCMALVLALSALVLAPAANAAKGPVETYVSTGDSLAFGYSQELNEVNSPNESPSYFEEGFDNFFAKNTLKKTSPGITIVNNGCPGETTNSYFGTGALKAFDPNASSACPYHFALGLPLHNSLGPLSQLEDTLSVLNPCFTKASVCAPAHPIVALSLAIGANDELAAIKKCEGEVKVEFETTGKSQYQQNETEPLPERIANSVKGCIVIHHTPVNEALVKNVETILGLIKNPSYGNYAGPVIFLGFYNPESFVLTGSDALQNQLNAEMEAAVVAAGAKYANPFPKFNPIPEQGPKEKKALERYTNAFNAKDIAANKVKWEANKTKEEGEGKTVIYPFNGFGDIHPTKLGYQWMAIVMAANYP